MKADYHIHTVYSDGKGPFCDYVAQAEKKRLDEIGFSDHVHVQKASWSMDPSSLPKYMKEINAVRTASKITIKTGLEVDFVPFKTDELMKTLHRFNFDYLIGSVHHIGDWLIDTQKQIHRWKDQDVDRVYQQYFMLVQEMVKARLFDIVGHIDVAKKFGFRPKNNITDLLLETVQIISKSDICVEINTSGLRVPCHEMYPSQDLLKMCFDHGVPIALGSDAHSPEDVAADFDQTVKLLHEVGYKQIATFSQRCREFADL